MHQSTGLHSLPDNSQNKPKLLRRDTAGGGAGGLLGHGLQRAANSVYDLNVGFIARLTNTYTRWYKTYLRPQSMNLAHSAEPYDMSQSGSLIEYANKQLKLRQRRERA